MSDLLHSYVRADSTRPCPKCGKPDWCLIHRSGKHCVCARTPGPRPYGDAGWLYYTPGGEAVNGTPPPKRAYVLPREVRRKLARVVFDANETLFKRDARAVCLSPTSIIGVRGGWSPKEAALAFPMHNGNGVPTGVLYRRRNGKKWSLKGGRNGLVISIQFDPRNPVFVVEGPTDAAAAYEAGLTNVLGRSSCGAGTRQLQKIMEKNPYTPVVFLADPDTPGKEGAARVAMMLPNPTCVMFSEYDVRDFVIRHPTRSDAGRSVMHSIYTPDQWRMYRKSEHFPFHRRLLTRYASSLR